MSCIRWLLVAGRASEDKGSLSNSGQNRACAFQLTRDGSLQRPLEGLAQCYLTSSAYAHRFKRRASMKGVNSSARGKLRSMGEGDSQSA